MGFQTTMVVLNDALHEIRDDKDFGEKVYDAALKISHSITPIDIHANMHANAASVIESHHADEAVMLVASGNTMVNMGSVGTWASTDPVNYLKKAADKMGYRLVKKPESKAGSK